MTVKPPPSNQPSNPDPGSRHRHPSLNASTSSSPEPINLSFLEPSDQPEALGQIGHYQVLQVLGRGEVGIVLRAFDESLRQVVAIKVLSPKLAAVSTARKRFIGEAQLAAKLQHENVVQIHALGEMPQPYIVMEYLPGQTLQQRLQKRGPMRVEEVVQIGVQIAHGLAAAHDAGLIHGDLKPGNVFLEEGPRCWVTLTDFGLASAADDVNLAQRGVVAGTPLYMAPEQVRGEAIDFRADLFSLGSVLYEMVSGRPAFQASDTPDVLNRVCEDPAQPLRDLIPELPLGLCGVIAKLHAKNPAERYPSAHAVEEVLSACLTQQPTRSELELMAAAPSPSYRVKKSQPAVKRSRGFLWFGVALGGLLLCVAAYFIYQAAIKNNDGENTAPTGNDTRAKPSIAELLTSPDYEWSTPENLGPGVNSKFQDWGVSLTADELTLAFTRDIRLMISRRKSLSEPFPEAVVVAEVSEFMLYGGPSMTSDGLLLVFSSQGPRRDRGEQNQIWMCRRGSQDEPFGKPKKLSAPVNWSNKHWEVWPLLSPDGLTLFTTTSRPGGQGNSGDIISFTRNRRDEDFGKEKLLPSPLNSPNFEHANWLSSDELVFCRTTTRGNVSDTHFFVRPKPDAAFGPPQSFGPTLDGIEIGRPWLSPDGERMYFHRADPEGKNNWDLWVTRRVPKPR